MKLFSKISMMALAALAFAACSQEDFTNDVNPTPEQGEKTWAYFSFSFKESMTRAGAGGENAATDGEAAVNTASVYIFNANGDLEEKATIDAYAGHVDGTYDAHAVAIEVISGPKTIVAILNDNKSHSTDDLASFLKLTEDADGNPTTLYSVEGKAIKDMLMTGKTTATLAANVEEADAKKPGNPSHIAVSVDRAAAKLDVVSSATDGKLEVVATSPIGELKGSTYDVLNLHAKPYTMLQSAVNGVIETPDYDLTTYSSYASKYYNASAEGVTPTLTFDSSSAYGSDVAYLPENTNIAPQVGNSSYVFIKSTFVPKDDKFVTGTTASSNAATIATLSSTPATGYAMFSYDYNYAFAPVATNALDDDQIETLIRHHLATNISGTSTDIKIAEKPIVIPATITKETYYYTKTEKTAEVAGKTCTVISLEKYVQGSANASVKDPSFTIADLTVGMYAWDNTNKGLTCYYRINIFDASYPKTEAMHFSVIRNNSYHVKISKVNSIGYPEAGDVEVNPETPLVDFPTYMQVEITINQWTSKDMDTEIGM